jgi:hypothetical protein
MFNPPRCHHLVWVECDAQIKIGGHQEDINQFVLDQAPTHIGPVFDLPAMSWNGTFDAQLFFKAPHCTSHRILAPFGMGAARIRPKARGVVFVESALLDQHVLTRNHKDRYRLVPQTLLVRCKLFEGLERAVHPCWNHRCHGLYVLVCFDDMVSIILKFHERVSMLHLGLHIATHSRRPNVADTIW